MKSVQNKIGALLLSLSLFSPGFSQITQLNSGTTTLLRNISVIDKNIFISGLTNNYLVKSYNECDQLVTLPSPSPSNYYHYLQRLDSDEVFLLSYDIGHATLHKSLDGGNSWLKKMDTTTFAPHCFGFFDSLEGITDKGVGKVLLRTNNGGGSWVSSQSPVTAIDVLKIYDDSMVIVGGLSPPSTLGYFHVSFDRGYSWPNAWAFSAQAFDLFILNKDTVFGVSYMGEFTKSTNGGMNWTDTNCPLNGVSKLNPGIHFKNYKEGYIVGGNQQGFGIIGKTVDMGQTWATFNTGIQTQLTNIAFLNDSVALLTGNNGVLLRWNYKNTIFTTLIEQELESKRLTVYPNPVGKKLRINLKVPIAEKVNVRILNTLGQTLYFQKDFILSDEIRTEFLQTGIYYLMIEKGENQMSCKIIKE